MSRRRAGLLFNTGLCSLYDKRFFIRGVLVISFTHQDGDFAWGVWAEVSSNDHDVYLDNYSNEFAKGSRREGVLANAIPGFSLIIGAPLSIELQGGNDRPSFAFPDAADHALAVDQRASIDHVRHHQFLEWCGYFDKRDA